MEARSSYAWLASFLLEPKGLLRIVPEKALALEIVVVLW